MKTRVQTYNVKLLKRKWLSKKTFEIILGLPPAFVFKPGQRISLILEGQERDYSIVSAPKESELTLCIRKVTGGKLSALLSSADIGSSLSVKGPHGYFTYKPSPRPAFFVATGTGIAPFCSMARSGISGFTLLHGVGLPEDLYYASHFRQSAREYIPCLTDAKKMPANAFRGRVTEYLEQHLTAGAYDFYLCGRSEMIRDVTLLIDERFPQSLVYTERFY
ncbi:MAG: FAD-binding oxidoreductase [Desulfobacterales bacterium]